MLGYQRLCVCVKDDLTLFLFQKQIKKSKQTNITQYDKKKKSQKQKQMNTRETGLLFGLKTTAMRGTWPGEG